MLYYGRQRVIQWHSRGTVATPPAAATHKPLYHNWTVYDPRRRVIVWQNTSGTTVVPPLPPEELAQIYGGKIFGQQKKKKHPPPLDIMVELIACTDGGKQSLIDTLPKREQRDLTAEIIAVSDLLDKIEAASKAVHDKVRRIYEERIALEEEDEDDELFLLTYQ